MWKNGSLKYLKQHLYKNGLQCLFISFFFKEKRKKKKLNKFRKKNLRKI